MNRARSRAIVLQEAPVTEVASEIGEALRAVADAINTLAGVGAWCAAAEHSDTHGRQSQMAAVIMRFAKEGFYSQKVNGDKVCEADEEKVRAMLLALFPHIDPRKLRR